MSVAMVYHTIQTKAAKAGVIDSVRPTVITLSDQCQLVRHTAMVTPGHTNNSMIAHIVA